MRRFAPLLIALALALSAAAHDAVYRDLGGRTLCLDPFAVAVTVDDDGFPQALAYAEVARELLGEALRDTLERHEVPVRERELCRSLAIRLAFTLRRSVDARERPYHRVLAELRVGRPSAETTADGELPDQRFSALAADALYPPGSGAEYYAGLTRYPAELIDDLATAWWDDLAYRPPPPRWLPYAGAILAATVSVVALLWARRRRR